MSELGWFLIFIVIIIITITLFFWAFSGTTSTGAVNNGNNGTVFQPGVGFVASTNTTAGTGWSSGMIIAAVIVFFLIIAIIVWAVYPRRPVVVPVPPPMPPPMVAPVGNPVVFNNSPAPSVAPTEYHHFYEPTVAPVAAPYAMTSPQPMVAARTPTGLPIEGHATYVRKSPDTFDPDPTSTTTHIPGRDVRGVYNHSQLGTVAGQYHQGGATVTEVTDVGRHQVVPTGAVNAVRTSYIGSGNPLGYARQGYTRVASIRV